jgi:hypothetical protein
MSGLKVTVISLAAFLLLEGLVFHSGFYTRFLAPASSSGVFETVLREEQKRKPSSPEEILVMGDSRIGEGFSSKIANTLCAEGGFYFSNVAVPGTTPRSWYYFLRDLDPSRKRYHAIILPLLNYGDIDIFEDMRDRMLDLHHCVARLRYADAFEFASSFHTFRKQIEAFRGTIFKGIIFQSDLLALFEHWHRRLSDIAECQNNFGKDAYDYVGNAEDLTGIQVDWETKTIQFPRKIPSRTREMIQEDLFSPVPKQEGIIAAYRRLWFGRILDLYRNSNTRFIFLALPRGPIVPPNPRIQPLSYSIQEMSRRSGVILLPENAFASLEQREFYFDALHLNARGRIQFSTILANSVLRNFHPCQN